MAFESRIRPRQFWFSVGYAALCAVLGAWGAYDYWERIPRQEREFQEYQQALATANRFAEMNSRGALALTAEQDAEYRASQAVIDRFASGAPTPVAAYDRPLQLWVYMIGCGILGTGWCVAGLVRTAPRSYMLDDDGTLHAHGRRIDPGEVTGIDMTRWMAKSIATLQVREGKPVVLDDYKFSGMHLIVGRFAHQFEPERWNADATLVKRPAAEAAEGSTPGASGGAPEGAGQPPGSPQAPSA